MKNQQRGRRIGKGKNPHYSGDLKGVLKMKLISATLMGCVFGVSMCLIHSQVDGNRSKMVLLIVAGLVQWIIFWLLLIC